MNKEIPYGYCYCGCGQQTSVIARNNTRRGCVKGERAKFIKGHTLSSLQRFSARYEIRESGCWEWTGRVHRQGYGFINHEGISQLAHRVSWQLFHGPIPTGLNILHRCDNPQCVNPNHLFLGTQKDNVHDCMNKGRMNNVGPASERAFGAKLSNETARIIRAYHVGHKVTQRELAAMFGVSQATVSRILLNRSWREA